MQWNNGTYPTSPFLYWGLIFAVISHSACGRAAPKQPDAPLASCDNLLTADRWQAAADCYSDAGTGEEPHLAQKAAYGEVLARFALTLNGTWAKLADLLPSTDAAAVFACEAKPDPRFAAAAQRRLNPEGVPLNLVIDDMFASGLTHAVFVRERTRELLLRDASYGFQFELSIPVRLSDLLDVFRPQPEMLSISGRFGRLELVHLQAIASGLSAGIQLLQAHDLTISDLGSLFNEPNFTTVLGREPHLFGLRDAEKLREAGRGLALFADAVSRISLEAEARFGDSEAWVIDPIDLYSNQRFDPRDILHYTFITQDMLTSKIQASLEDAGFEPGWITFPAHWPPDFFDILSRGSRALSGNLDGGEPLLIELSQLAPLLAVFGFQAGPLVDVAAIDPYALIVAEKGVRDYLPFYACDQERCLPLESPEWLDDRAHFADTITSTRPITPEQEKTWEKLLAQHGYDPAAVDHIFSLNMTLPVDGIHYAPGTTGPVNIYRLYRDPTFGGALIWDVRTYMSRTSSAAQIAFEAGRQAADEQFVTNAILAWYTRETRIPSPFAEMRIFSGFRFFGSDDTDEGGCRLQRGATIPPLGLLIAIGLPWLWWRRLRGRS